MCMLARIAAMMPITRLRPSSIRSILHSSPFVRYENVVRSSHWTMKKKTPWSRNDKLAVAGIVVAVMAFASAFFIPEVRRLFGLEKPPVPVETVTQGETTTKEQATTMNNPSSQSVAVQPPVPAGMQNGKTLQHSSTHKAKTVVTEAEAESRVIKMTEEYKLKHGECPTVVFVNGWLRTQGVPFHVASMRCEVNHPGTFTFLNDEGKVNEASIGKITIEGSPAPNTNTTLFHVAPGGELGKLTVNEAHVHNWLPEALVPAPPPDAPRDNFHSRIKDLNKEMWDWKQGLEAASPSVTDPQYYQYWSAKMAEFHNSFGGRLTLLAKQLRKCGNTQAIYDRERNKVDSSAMIELDISDLWTIDSNLPQDEKQIQCANE